jgi:hypothetical protein
MSDIKVNASEWNALSEQNRSQITAIIKEHGFLTGGDKIVGDPAAAKAAEVVRAASTHLGASAQAHKAVATAAAAPAGFNWCKVGCDVAEAGAVAACALVPPPGNVVCIAAAHAGGEFCRSKCT